MTHSFKLTGKQIALAIGVVLLLTIVWPIIVANFFHQKGSAAVSKVKKDTEQIKCLWAIQLEEQRYQEQSFAIELENRNPIGFEIGHKEV